MCSVEEDDGETRPVCAAPAPTTGGACERCHGAQRAKIRSRQTLLCRECFFEYVDLQYRRQVGANRRRAPADAHCLLGVSGGLSSMVMLKLTYEAVSQVSPRDKSRLVLGVCLIDESALLPALQEKRRAQLDAMVREIQRIAPGVPVHRIQLETIYMALPPDGLGLSDRAPSDTNESLEAATQLRALFAATTTMTAREDLLRTLRRRLLLRVAGDKGYRQIWTGEDATHLAARTLENVAKGRGYTLAMEVKGCSEVLIDGILFVRPLKQISTKDLAFFAQWKGLSWFSSGPAVSEGLRETGSIGRLTEEFICGLETTGFHATVSTVLRVGEKLSSLHLDGAGVVCCVLCGAVMDAEEQRWSKAGQRARGVGGLQTDSGERTKELTKECTDECSASQTGCGGGGGGGGGTCSSGTCASSSSSSTHPEHSTLSPSDLSMHCCHGCRVLLRETRTQPLPATTGTTTTTTSVQVPFPPFVTSAWRAAEGRRKMRQEISAYLIDDSD